MPSRPNDGPPVQSCAASVASDGAVRHVSHAVVPVPSPHPWRPSNRRPPAWWPNVLQPWQYLSVFLLRPVQANESAFHTAEQGRTGALTFVVVGHRILQGDRIVVDERQDSAYRDAVWPSRQSAEPEPREGAKAPPAEGEWVIDTSPTLLFHTPRSPTAATASTPTATTPAMSRDIPVCSCTGRCKPLLWPRQLGPADTPETRPSTIGCGHRCSPPRPGRLGDARQPCARDRSAGRFRTANR